MKGEDNFTGAAHVEPLEFRAYAGTRDQKQEEQGPRDPNEEDKAMEVGLDFEGHTEARPPKADQNDEDMEATLTKEVNARRVIWENKNANLSTMIRPGVNIDANQFTVAAREISQVEAVVQKLQCCGGPVHIK